MIIIDFTHRSKLFHNLPRTATRVREDAGETTREKEIRRKLDKLIAD